MKRCISLLFCIISVCAFAQQDENALEQALYDLPNISFEKISRAGDANLKYVLMIKQPVDHFHREHGFFYQRVVLTHKGFTNPTVMETQGYSLRPESRNEIEKVFDANNLNIEHRYFGKSIPDPEQWEYLTLEQATADLHVINELFRNVYKGKWLSTGISKGGSTTMYYKYFFPADIDLAIPYVGPINNSRADTRLYAFLDTMGPKVCRDKIKQFQLFLLKHEKEAIDKLTWYSKGADLHYDYTGSVGKSFEYAVLEYPFSFWQYYDNTCDSIPTNNSLDDYLSMLLKVADISSFADEGLAPFESFYYQAATQFGYYGYRAAPFKKYLHYFTEDPSGAFPPKSATVNAYDGTVNAKVIKWLATEATDIIAIYGGNDTWTATGADFGNRPNTKKYIIPNANHATARIKSMPPAMQQSFVAAAKAMAGLDASVGVLR